MGVTTLEVGDLAVNCYIVSSDGIGQGEKPCVVIDPGGDAAMISSEVRRQGLRVETVLLTHAHGDHIGGVEEFLKEWPGAVLACSAETSRRAGDPRLNLSVYLREPIAIQPAGRILADGESFEAAGMRWRAVEVPGHDPGEMVYILGDGGMAFTGDTVFAGSVGRSDFPGGDGHALIAGVRALLKSLPPDCILFPGHGPDSTVQIELEYNPFLR